MKTTLYLLILFALLASCQLREETPELLSQAEACMELHPDSALSILRQLPSPEKLRGSQQADYALLMTQAMHKNHLLLTSDSLISIAVNFYQNSNHALRKGQSYYYSGIICEAREDHNAAFDYYLHAQGALQGSENFKILGLVNASIGRLYYEKGLYEESLGYKKRAALFFRQINDSLSVSISIRSVGRSYLLLNKLDSADFYLEEAYLFATTDEQRIGIQYDKQIVYVEQGEYQKGADVFLRVINREGRSTEDRACTYLALGDFYLKQGEKEKAQNCFLKSLELGNVETQAASIHLLYHLEKEGGNHTDALAYLEQFSLFSDSINHLRSGTETVAIQLKYDKVEVERELYQKHTQLWLSLFLATLLLLLSLFLWRHYQTYRRRKGGELLCVEALLTKTEAEIVAYKVQLVEAEQLLDVSRQNRETLLSEKIQIEVDLHQKEGMLARLEAEKEQIESNANRFKLLLQTNKPVLEGEHRLIAACRLYKLLVACPQKSNCHTSEDWELLFFWTDITCRQFYTRLRKAYPLLRNRDLHICCLIKLRFSNDDLRLIFDIQQGTLYTDKNRVKHLLGLEAEVKLENWLLLF